MSKVICNRSMFDKNNDPTSVNKSAKESALHRERKRIF